MEKSIVLILAAFLPSSQLEAMAVFVAVYGRHALRFWWPPASQLRPCMQSTLSGQSLALASRGVGCVVQRAR